MLSHGTVTSLRRVQSSLASNVVLRLVVSRVECESSLYVETAESMSAGIYIQSIKISLDRILDCLRCLAAFRNRRTALRQGSLFPFPPFGLVRSDLQSAAQYNAGRRTGTAGCALLISNLEIMSSLNWSVREEVWKAGWTEFEPTSVSAGLAQFMET
jgi:hypothetical protein